MSRIGLIAGVALIWLGVVACKDDLRDEVRACDRRVVAHMPFAKERSAEVLKLCDKALAINDLTSRERIIALYTRGEIYTRREEFALATADFEAIRKIDNNSPYAARGFGFIEYLRNNDLDALKYFEEAIRLDPRDATLIALRGGVRYRLKQYDDAIKDLDLALDVPAGMHMDKLSVPGARLMRSLTRIELRRYAEAKEDAGFWIRENPEDPWGYMARGVARTEIGDLSGAIEDFDKAVMLKGSVRWMSEKLTALGGPYFGPQDSSYEGGIRYALRTLQRLQKEVFPLTDLQRSDRRDKLFPEVVFSSQRTHLYMLETGFAPLLLHRSRPEDRMVANIYYGYLLGAMQESGDPACRILIKSLDSMAAQLAGAKNVHDWFKGTGSALEGVIKGIATLATYAVMEELGTKDAMALVGRHGCSSSVVINILKNGSTYLTWSMSQ